MQKSRPTQNKRARERARQEKQQQKAARRLQAKSQRSGAPAGSALYGSYGFLAIALVTILGGVGSLGGPVIGAVILTAIEETTRAMFGGTGRGTDLIIYAVLIILVSVFYPSGNASLQRFIATPAATLEADALGDITASGPPLPVLLRSLEVLRDMRTGAKRADLATRHPDLARLRSRITAI